MRIRTREFWGEWTWHGAIVYVTCLTLLLLAFFKTNEEMYRNTLKPWDFLPANMSAELEERAYAVKRDGP